ncbi:MAG: hypothetical protein JWN95_1928 [Frankiales bacterium]|nr:hypothetical protein [Frankiales bacterium]
MSTTDQPGPPKSLSEAKGALRKLVDQERDRHPLVIAFAAPLGTDLETIIVELETGFELFGYDTKRVPLSDFLDGVANAPWQSLPRRGAINYYQQRMDAGDDLRRDTGIDGALAALAATRIAQLRPTKNRTTAYLLPSLKHPDEAELLRHIYGDAFWLVAVVSGPDDRRDDFAEKLARDGATFDDGRAQAQLLIDRDENDQAKPHGQHVQKVFAKADVFLPYRRGHASKKDVERFLDGIFGQPFFTPYAVEEGMRLAHSASLRSASMARQVGAVLLPVSGTTYVTGTNEVPKPGGGQFWAGDEPDHRDFQAGDDPNPSHMATMLKELFGRLIDWAWLEPRFRRETPAELLVLAQKQDDNGESVLKGTRVESVIEFTRCLHAEQASIVNAARQGISTQDALLITTTFPCHECAKFIVGAGVRRVVYIEPYPKSMVRHLYRDLIDTRPPLPAAEAFDDHPPAELTKVPFSAFVGFAPHRYDDVFVAGTRREGVAAARFNRKLAHPRGGGWSEVAVAERERSTANAIGSVIAQTYPLVVSSPAEVTPAPPTKSRKARAQPKPEQDAPSRAPSAPLPQQTREM